MEAQIEEEAHLHFRAQLRNLCRPLLICSWPPHPPALNASKPQTAGVPKGSALEFINSFKATQALIQTSSIFQN